MIGHKGGRPITSKIVLVVHTIISGSIPEMCTTRTILPVMGQLPYGLS